MKMIALPPPVPSQIRGGEEDLIQVLQVFGRTGREIVVDQHQIRNEALFRIDLHLEPRSRQHGLESGDILPIKEVSSVFLRKDQRFFDARVPVLEEGLEGLGPAFGKGFAKIVESGGKEVRVHDRDLEAGVADIHGAVNGRLGPGEFRQTASVPVV
jgi:hypothetical protein